MKHHTENRPRKIFMGSGPRTASSGRSVLGGSSRTAVARRLVYVGLAAASVAVWALAAGLARPEVRAQRGDCRSRVPSQVSPRPEMADPRCRDWAFHSSFATSAIELGSAHRAP